MHCISLLYYRLLPSFHPILKIELWMTLRDLRASAVIHRAAYPSFYLLRDFFFIGPHFNKSWRLIGVDRKWERFEVLKRGSWEMSFGLTQQ